MTTLHQHWYEIISPHGSSSLISMLMPSHDILIQLHINVDAMLLHSINTVWNCITMLFQHLISMLMPYHNIDMKLYHHMVLAASYQCWCQLMTYWYNFISMLMQCCCIPSILIWNCITTLFQHLILMLMPHHNTDMKLYSHDAAMTLTSHEILIQLHTTLHQYWYEIVSPHCSNTLYQC